MNLLVTRQRHSAGFTLIEVVLATVIAVGMLLIVLFCYQQAANLRDQVLQETERLSVLRLLMDRITSELRSTRRHAAFAGAFVGESDSIQFIKTDLPSRAAWAGGTLGRVVSGESDLKLVGYRPGSADGTNTTGLARWEQPLLKSRQPTGAQDSLNVEIKTNRPSALLSEEIHFIHFRYWDGKSWQESWHSEELPEAVEVSLGTESLPTGTVLAEYPGELFRRVIYVPASGEDSQWTAPVGVLGRPERSISQAWRREALQRVNSRSLVGAAMLQRCYALALRPSNEEADL